MRYLFALAAFVGLYLLLAGEVGETELIAGCPAALAATLLLAAHNRVARHRLALPWRALPKIGRAVAGAVPETAGVGLVLARAVLRRPAGEAGTVANEAQDAAAAGIDILARSLAPNAYVLSAAQGRVRLHRLAHV